MLAATRPPDVMTNKTALETKKATKAYKYLMYDTDPTCCVDNHYQPACICKLALACYCTCLPHMTHADHKRKHKRFMSTKPSCICGLSPCLANFGIYGKSHLTNSQASNRNPCNAELMLGKHPRRLQHTIYEREPTAIMYPCQS